MGLYFLELDHSGTFEYAYRKIVKKTYNFFVGFRQKTVFALQGGGGQKVKTIRCFSYAFSLLFKLFFLIEYTLGVFGVLGGKTSNTKLSNT